MPKRSHKRKQRSSHCVGLRRHRCKRTVGCKYVSRGRKRYCRRDWDTRRRRSGGTSRRRRGGKSRRRSGGRRR